MHDRADVSPHIVDVLRAICLALPEAHEEVAWVGTRWRIRTRTFAHVVPIEGGWPPAYARAARRDDAIVITFQSAGEELEALGRVGDPFFRPPWRPGIVGRILADDADWDEITELVTESYCLLAPERLRVLVARPDG